MGAHQIGGNRQAQPGSSGPGRSLKRLEQALPDMRRNARPIVADLDEYVATGLPCPDFDAGGLALRRARRLQGFRRIAV